MNIFLFEKQLEMPGGMVYFPFASGLLTAFAKKHAIEHEFFINQPVNNPDIAAFSVSLWNRNYCIKKAVEILERFPNCRIIFGGPSAEEIRFEWAETIIGEGESKFLKAISGIDKPIGDQLDDIPSPYLSGVFDNIPGNQAIIETNRGCPFGCAYCFWGKGEKRQAMKFHSMDYIKAEAEWLGKHRIPYVFCADGNFGMFPRDIEIARTYAKTKRKYGFPEKFRVCYGKNAEDSVFEAAEILAKAGLSKSMTLSPQTRNPRALEFIGRKNIRNDFFDRIQSRCQSAGIPVYSELILGLPGETFNSFKDGLLQTMRSGNQLFVYLCECLPGTRLFEPAYRNCHQIKTRHVKMTPVHCRPLFPEESEEIVISTADMPEADWKLSAVLSWMVQLYYSFKLLDMTPDEILEFCLRQMNSKNAISEYFQKKADDILSGSGRCDLINGIYFEPEEVAFLEYFGSGGDPVKEVIYARKNNFNKREMVTA